MTDISPSRRTTTVPIDSEQYARLANLGIEIGHYDIKPHCRRDNAELVLTTLIDVFEAEHIDD